MYLLSFFRLFRRSAVPNQNYVPQSKNRPRFCPQVLTLEDRWLMSVFTPLLPMEGTHQAKGLNSVLYTPELDKTLPVENRPDKKLVTIQNNSSTVVYPILYAANGTQDDTAGKVVRVTLTNPGSGYNKTNVEALWPKVKIINLTRNPSSVATATVKVDGLGKLTGLVLKDGGAGYKPGDQLKVEFDDSANGNKGSGGAATAVVSNVDPESKNPVSLYNPKDDFNRTYRGYIGEKDANGKYALGLQPGRQATIQVPIAFWDGGRLYFATNGPIPMRSETDPGNPLQNNTEWFYDEAKPSYLVKPTDEVKVPLYGANFSDPVSKIANDKAVVLWYADKAKDANDFGFSTPAQLTEWTFRDPKQFHIAPNMKADELDTIANYDVSYVDSLSMPASMAGTLVPLRGVPDGAPNFPPANFAFLGSDMSLTQMQEIIGAFTTTNLTPQAGVPGPNGLGTYFGGLGYDQYYMPGDNSPSGRILSVSNPSNGDVKITVGVTGALHKGATIKIEGLTGQTELNGTWKIRNVSGTADVVHFDLDGIQGNGTPSSGGTYSGQNAGVAIKKVPAGYQVIADSPNQNVQSGFDSTRYSLASGGTMVRIETRGTGTAEEGSPVIKEVNADQAARLAPGMILLPEEKNGQPYFPKGTKIKSITQGTPGQNNATIELTNNAKFGRSGQTWAFNGSQFQSELGKIEANTNVITNLDPQVGIYLRPGMVVNGTNVPPGTFISNEPDSISKDFKTVKLTQSIGSNSVSGPITFTGQPYSYVVRKLIDVWYSWADYYVRQLNSDGPNKAPSGSFQGTTLANKGREDYNSLILKINDDNFNMGQLRVGSIVTASNNTLTPNQENDNSLNYTITKIDQKARTVSLSLPVAVTTATADTFSFVPPKYIIRSEDAPKAPGTLGTIPYTLDFASATPAQQKSALDFARTVYDVMQSFSLLVDPQTLLSRSALLLRYSIGGNVGSFKANDDLFFNITKRHTMLPHNRTHVELRDEIKSILRGVFDFMDPSLADPVNWYPDPAVPTPGATLDTGTGPKPIDFGVYNLNPYVWFVHTQLKMSGYGFSLDDDVANTTANTNTLQVAFGGNMYTAPGAMDNQSQKLANFEVYSGGARFGTQKSQGYIQGSSKTSNDFPGETWIAGLDQETVLKLVASTEVSDPIGALITGQGLPPGIMIRHTDGRNPVKGENLAFVTFKTPEGWTPPVDNQPLTEFTFSGFTTELPQNVKPEVTSAKPGSMVTIIGSGFEGAIGVTFNGIPGKLIENRITGIENANGSPITIKTSSTTGLTEGETVTISRVLGQTGINRQWVVTNVTDTSFQLKGSTGNGVASSAGEWLVGTDSSIKVIVPSFIPNINGTSHPGPVGKVGVRTPSGTDYSEIDFTIGETGNPTFSGIGQPGSSTASGPLKSTVKLFGTGFGGTSAVTFNGSSTPINTFTPNSTGTELTLTIPVGASGTGTFTITVGGTTYTSTGFTFTVSPPTIAASNPFTPTSGPVGTLVTIKGTGFSGADDPSTGGVTINGVAATHVTVLDDNTLTAKVGPGSTSGPVVVKTSAGSGNSGSNSFTVSAFQTPTITSATPGQGAVGAQIELKGTNFSGVNLAGGGVTFGGVAATTIRVVDDQTLRVEVPVGAQVGSAPIVVSNPGGLSSSPFAFTVVAPTQPVITSFTPQSGEAGAQVTIKGSGFTNTSLVQFNLTEAGFVIKDDTTILATVPQGATTGPITVKTGLGTATSQTSFVVGVDPEIDSFSPTSGSAGTVVTIQGSGFSSVNLVKFNGVDAAEFTVVDDDTMTAVVPQGATTGKITIGNSAGHTGESATDFKVITIVKPAITSFTPGRGKAGTTVTLTGTGFTGATAVKFNGVAASVFTVVNDTSITVTVPAQASTGPITVTNSAGSGASQNSFIVEAANIPAFIKVSSGSPQSNPINGPYDNALKALVTDSDGKPLSGIHVTFTAPTTGATGKFANGTNTVIVTTGADGIATAPVFTANGTVGAFIVTANVTPGLATPARFSLTNIPVGQGYVNQLFVTFLGRNGNQAELKQWVETLATKGREAVVNGIMRSEESSKRIVDGLFTKLLGRSTSNPRDWIAQIQNGATIEALIVKIVRTNEFVSRAKTLFSITSDKEAVVRGLFKLLLNRDGTNEAIQAKVNAMGEGENGREVVARDFLATDEFRTGAVRTFYGDPTQSPSPFQPFFSNVMRRISAPSRAEISKWVVTKRSMGLLEIQREFAESDEFYQRSLR